MLITVALASSCALCRELTPGETKPAEILKVNAGQVFVITLAANPSTGFHWQFATPPDSKFLTLINSKYVLLENAIPGRGGNEYWTFESLRPGSVKVSVEYRCSSKKEVAPEAVRIFTVQISSTRQDFTDPEVPINMVVGKGFAVSLEANPTTGYAWQFAGELPKAVRLVNSQFIASNTKLLGAPGRQVWTFAAATPGTAVITLNYRRPWETGKPPVLVRKFTVHVGEK